MDKKNLSERDICTKFITPALESASWNKLTQLPPLVVQSRIVARVVALRALCADLRQSLTACQKIQTHRRNAGGASRIIKT